MPPTSKKLKGQIVLGLLVCPSINPPTHPPVPHLPPLPNYFLFRFGFWKKNKITCSSHLLPRPPRPPRPSRPKKIKFGFIVEKKITYSSPHPLTPRTHPHPPKNNFRLGFLITKIHLIWTPSPSLPPPPLPANFFFFSIWNLCKKTITYSSPAPPRPAPPFSL